MAGAGKKTFTAGETLTASDVNTYLMEQSVMVFGGTAARSSAIPTPSEGMTTYRTDTQQIESYDGAEWRGMSGLQLVKKQTIGTGVSSVTVTNAFSATYDNYKIIITGGVLGASTADLNLQLTGITGSVYYTSLIYSNFGASTPLAATSNTTSNAWAGAASTNGLFMNYDIANPFTSTTKFSSANFINGATTATNGTSRGWINSTASATGFTVTCSSSSMTGGTIYVYGYGT